MSGSGQFFESLALSVAQGLTVKAATEIARCSESHGYRLSRTESFKQRVSELRSEITSEALGKLTRAATTAVDTLVELMGAENEPPVRMNAAKAILANLGPLSELSELRSRLEAIESERRPKAKVSA